MTVICTNIIVEERASLTTLARLMRSIQNQQIERPELQIEKVTEKGDAYGVNALFEADGSLAGWLVIQRPTETKDVLVFCKANAKGASQELFHCGSPERIEGKAILTRKEVIGLFDKLMMSVTPAEYTLARLLDVSS